LDVDKLTKCRLLDNTEMCQWIKKYFELHYSGQEYDPIARRNGQDLHYILGGSKVGAPPKGKSGASTTVNRPPTTTTAKPRISSNTGPKMGNPKNEALEAKVAELEANTAILDKEREFYFSKLRLIEEMI